MWQNGSWQAQPEVGGHKASCVGFFKFAGCVRLRLTLSTPSNLEDSILKHFQRTFHRSLDWSPEGDKRKCALDGTGT